MSSQSTAKGIVGKVTPLIALAAVGGFAACGSSAGIGGASVERTTSSLAVTAGLDYEYYRENIEPLFIRPRGGPMPGEAACVMCHTWQTNIRFKLEALQETEMGGVFWSEEQSRRNFEVVSRVVEPGDPDNSRLLLKPLTPAAGGLAHSGGTYWESRDEVEWQVIADWVRAASRVARPTPPNVDFDFFRYCVQPMFVNPAPGMVNCTNCHGGGGITGFARPPANGRDWTEAESRQNYETVMRLIIPGDPDGSRFLLKPLVYEAGGEYAHNGGRRWTSKSDPEWQTLAVWVRGEAAGCTE